MPVQAIIAQPTTDSIAAAYRPVALRMSATTNTAGGGPTPPVVYCDIYFNDVFYKTLSKTQYTSLPGANTEWEFDIQDAAQEFLRKFIAPIAESTILEATPITCKAFCKFRCSGFDANGFILPDGTIPIQATSSSAAVAGTGLQSNTFYIVNSTLQHQDVQDLATHLASFKLRTWTADALPLSHRRDGYVMAPGDSDSFPIIYMGDNSVKSLRINYRYCNQTTFGQSTLAVGPEPVCTATISNPSSIVIAGGHLIQWNVTSGAPAKYFISTPAINGGAPAETTATFYALMGLPVGTHIVTVRPLCFISGTYYFGAAKTVTIVVSACVAVGIEGSPALPTAFADTAYSYSFDLTGTAPFGLTGITKPGWMTIVISGNSVVFGGTPTSGDVAPGNTVSFTVTNCASDTIDFDGTVDVEEPVAEGRLTILNFVASSLITDVTDIVVSYDTGGLPVSQGGIASGLIDPFTGAVHVEYSIAGPGTHYLRTNVNGSLYDCQPVSGTDLAIIPPRAYLVTDIVEIRLHSIPC